jgi:hypothetical protein
MKKICYLLILVLTLFISIDPASAAAPKPKSWTVGGQANSSSMSYGLGSYISDKYEITAITATGWTGRKDINPTVRIGSASASLNMPNKNDTYGISMTYYPDATKTTDTSSTGTVYITKYYPGRSENSTAYITLSAGSTVGFSNIDYRGGQYPNFGTVYITYQEKLPKTPVITGDIKTLKPGTNESLRSVKTGGKVDVRWQTYKN